MLGHVSVVETESHQGPVPGPVLSSERVEPLLGLMDRYRVDFGVWSHDRWYERSKPMRGLEVAHEVTGSFGGGVGNYWKFKKHP